MILSANNVGERRDMFSITTRKLRPKEPDAQGLTIRKPILILGDSIAFLIGNK